jgi:hypothetical protein
MTAKWASTDIWTAVLELEMARTPSLGSMSVEALLKLRDDVGGRSAKGRFGWRNSFQAWAARWAVDGAVEGAR